MYVSVPLKMIYLFLIVKSGKSEEKFTKTHTVPATSTASVSPADEELIRSELASMDSNANEMQNSQNG